MKPYLEDCGVWSTTHVVIRFVPRICAVWCQLSSESRVRTRTALAHRAHRDLRFLQRHARHAATARAALGVSRAACGRRRSAAIGPRARRWSSTRRPEPPLLPSEGFAAVQADLMRVIRQGGGVVRSGTLATRARSARHAAGRLGRGSEERAGRAHVHAAAQAGGAARAGRAPRLAPPPHGPVHAAAGLLAWYTRAASAESALAPHPPMHSTSAIRSLLHHAAPADLWSFDCSVCARRRLRRALSTAPRPLGERG